MTRQVITIDKIRKCHVVETGDDAGYPIYETETAYEAPDKWAFVPIKTLS